MEFYYYKHHREDDFKPPVINSELVNNMDGGGYLTDVSKSINGQPQLINILIIVSIYIPIVSLGDKFFAYSNAASTSQLDLNSDQRRWANWRRADARTWAHK